MNEATDAARAVASAQFDFGGMDLSDDSAASKPKKKKKKTSSKKKSSKKKATASKKKKSTKAQEETTAATMSDSDSAASAGLGVDMSAPAPAATPASEAAPADSGAMSFGMDLNAPAASPEQTATPAAPPPPAAPPTNAPVMSFDAVDVAGKSAERQRLDAAIKLFNEKRYETAALALHEVLKDPNMFEHHDEAQYTLAKTFYRMGLYHSALNHFKILLDKGENTKLFKTCLEWLFYIARKTVNEQVVLDEVARHAGADFPERFRSEFRYLLARYHFNRGRALSQIGQDEDANVSFGEAKKLILMIPSDD